MAQQSSSLSLEKVILKVINRYFDVSLIMGIMLTGSRVTNKHREDSDVDVMLISKLSNRQTISMIRERNYTFQFIIVPFNKLSSMIADDYISGSFVFHSMINKGIILKDTFGILATYKEKLSKVSVQLSGYICKEEHYEARMSILNYTHLCKRKQYWDEVTMWCRGLIVDNDNHILFRPMKKFFERNQLYHYFVPHGNKHFELYEKKDGALGILYWLADFPFIATRGSFTSKQAIIGTSLLYSKYSSEIPKMSKSYTYFFEIITPRDKHVVDYGEIEDLFLIGAYDNNNLCDVLSHRLADLNFPNVKHYQQHDHIKDLEKQDMPNEEGYVAYYEDGTRVKIKFKSYKNKHIELFNNIKF